MDLLTQSKTSSKTNNLIESNVTATFVNNNNNQLIMDEELFTPIQKFYDNCNIFITGGTGFLGKSKYIDTFFVVAFNLFALTVTTKIV